MNMISIDNLVNSMTLEQLKEYNNQLIILNAQLKEYNEQSKERINNNNQQEETIPKQQYTIVIPFDSAEKIKATYEFIKPCKLEEKKSEFKFIKAIEESKAWQTPYAVANKVGKEINVQIPNKPYILKKEIQPYNKAA